MPKPTRRNGPARLTVRVSATDEVFVRGLHGLTPGTAPAPHRPSRLMVDAHVPLTSGGGLARVAREAGIPFLVDPETAYLQDVQHPDAPWCAVPFAIERACIPADISSPSTQAAMVKAVVDYQIAHGATAVIAPYVHVETPTSGWATIQAGLWRRTAAYVAKAGINLRLIGVVAIGWRCLHPIRGVPALSEMWDALAALAPHEVALAASKVHLGAHPEDRIAELLMLVRHLSATYTLTMWQQGILGETCVIEGAAGYECGIGRREQCNLPSRIAQYRSPRSGHPGPRHVYLSELGRGVPKRRLELARGKRAIWAQLICPFPDCCAPAGQDLLGDARRHSVVARARDLEQLDAAAVTTWRWNRLSERLREGLILANQLNALAPQSRAVPAIDTISLRALYEVANARRARGATIRRTA